MVVGLALIVISLISATVVLRSKADSIVVLVFAREINAGARLGEADLAETEVAAPSKTLEQLVRSVDRDSIVGMRLARSVRAGEPVVRSAISPGSSPTRVVSFPVTRAGSSPDLTAGENVDVLASFAAESGDARTVVIASGVPLVSISEAVDGEAVPRVPGGGPGVGDPDRVIAAVEVGGPQLVPLVFASQNSVVSLVRSIPGEDLLGWETSALAAYESGIPEE